ncbi:PREDICTED: pentatricopeptide repeat-containing protein At2g27800, mitochondrial [Tarenaya hassleriana]|uniref:pentatricopeptide repeat-containing protein At2g27800, mitochondrial n=1 Tax=Tarenaya hassleriana TaxID=28532 RepID=UPI00053C1515|nr:PREDICTED: pentatricopeptide repeat-containing protein At2g27800, mitochondrial [Tarenaya hassleriana]
MAAIGVAGRSTLLGPILRTATARTSIASRARFSVPNPNSASARLNSSSLRQARTEVSASRFFRRELSTQQPFYSVVASACLVSKLPSDVTASYEGRFANYVSPI